MVLLARGLDQGVPLYGGQLIQGGSNMTGTDLYVNKPHCVVAVRP